MKKVIEHRTIEFDRSFLDVQYLSKTTSIYHRFNNQKTGENIIIPNEKAREVALVICPELESELKEAVELIYKLTFDSPNLCESARKDVDAFLTKHKSKYDG